MLAGAGRFLLPGAADLGPAPGSVRQRVDLVLRLRDRTGLDRLITSQATRGSADYQRWLTPAQFADRFSPTPQTVRTATAWARAAGLTVEAVSPNRTVVTLVGTRTQLNRALHVQLRTVRLGRATYVTPDRAATLPPAVASGAAALLRLTTYQAFRTLHTQAAPLAQPAGAFGPQDFYETYHAPSGATGTGQSVGVITNGDLDVVAQDLRQFQTRFGLRRVPLVVVQAGPASADTSGAMEYDLDTQYASAFAPGAKSVVAYNGAQLGDLAPLNKFVTDRKLRTASASYGGCELVNLALGDVTADDQVFMQADAQGQTFWVSSGDTGSACAPSPAGPIPHQVSYPASSRYVVAVGGTTLTDAPRQPEGEITWSGGGGGQSQYESAPAWQRNAGAFVTRLGRGVPDVSLDADPKSGYLIVAKGKLIPIGGTSASAPAWNGIWARVLQTHPKAGFAAPALYDRSGPALIDITLGDNGDYAAAPGYDLATGLGSVNITTLINKIGV